MNKKQLIVAWVITVVICAILLFYPKIFCSGDGKYCCYAPLGHHCIVPVTQWGYVAPICLSILIISALLIYTLRDKKK